MPQLDPSSFASQLFWLFISFGLLYYIMHRYILPQITMVLEQREQKVSGDLDRAEVLRREAREAQLAYDRSLMEARTKANDIMMQMNKLIAEESVKRHGKLDETLLKQTNEADIRLSRLRKDAKIKLANVAAEISQDIIKKLVGRVVPKSQVDSVMETLAKGEAK